MDIAAGGGNGIVVLGIVVLIVLIGLYTGCTVVRARGVRPRRVETSLTAEQLRGIFAEQVAGDGWSIVDDGGRVAAQSGLLAGVRQRIVLTVAENGERTVAGVTVTRYAKNVSAGVAKAGSPSRRIDAFLAEVQRIDASASVAG